MNRLFETFNISVANFAELSGCVFSWLEEHCKPQVNYIIYFPFYFLKCMKEIFNVDKHYY